MKVEQPDAISKQQTLQKKTKTLSDKSADFKIALEEAVAITRTDPVLETSTLLEVQAINRIGIPFEADDLTTKTEYAIDLLDQYTQLLGNPEKSLKEIEPALDLLLREADLLNGEMTNEPETLPGIRSIIEQLQFTAQLEQLKFFRGDYIDRF